MLLRAQILEAVDGANLYATLVKEWCDIDQNRYARAIRAFDDHNTGVRHITGKLG
jgi:hypothetical protein